MIMFVRTASFTLALIGAGNALAQGMPDTWRMSCAASAETVRRAGAIVMHSGPNIFDRYVISQSFCHRDEIMRPRWVQTGDNPQCFIGYACEREAWGPGPQ